ncbi:MAG: hypothetical protein Q9160_009327 [Pyrenula sp. 1 TL-2023]
MTSLKSAATNADDAESSKKDGLNEEPTEEQRNAWQKAEQQFQGLMAAFQGVSRLQKGVDDANEGGEKSQEKSRGLMAVLVAAWNDDDPKGIIKTILCCISCKRPAVDKRRIWD